MNKETIPFIFKPGDRAYWLNEKQWVELEENPENPSEYYPLRIKNGELVFTEEGKDVFFSPYFSFLPINPYDPFDPNNPPEFRASRWIPVEERLPEEGVEVIVYSKGVGVIPDISYVKGRWIWDAGIIKNVTHWQPLPKGPEDK